MIIRVFALLLLIAVSTTGMSQTKRIEKKAIYTSLWVKTGYPNQEVSCERVYTKLFISRRRVIFECDRVSFDMRVFSRTKNSWKLRDKDGSTYTLYPVEIQKTVGFLFAPDDYTKLGVVIINYNLCEQSLGGY